MPVRKSIAWFAVKFLVIYGLLAASWPVVGRAYAGFFRESGKLFFTGVGVGQSVRIRRASDQNDMNDTRLLVWSSDLRRWIPVEPSSWVIGYEPSCLLMALIVATPVSRYRRFWGLGIGLILIHMVVLARLGAIAVLSVSVAPDIPWVQALAWPILDLLVGRTGSWLIPVLIWVPVTLRREDAQKFWQPTETASVVPFHAKWDFSDV